MTRAFLVLFLILGQFPAAAGRRRAVGHPEAPIPPAPLVTAACEAAEATLTAGVPVVQIAVSHRGRIIHSEAFGLDLHVPATRAQVIKALNGNRSISRLEKAGATATPATCCSALRSNPITGKPFADFVRDESALPLGLLDTGVCGTSNLPLLEGYGVVPQLPLLRMKPLHPSIGVSSGALCSTASDLARWAHLIATGYGMLPGSYATMTTPARYDNNVVVPNGYAAGNPHLIALAVASAALPAL